MMNQTIHFIKMHGVGNDYIFVDTSLYPIEKPQAAFITWHRYDFGISSDGESLPEGVFVSMGNPHYAIFVDDINAVDVEAVAASQWLVELALVQPQSLLQSQAGVAVTPASSWTAAPSTSTGGRLTVMFTSAAPQPSPLRALLNCHNKTSS